MGDEVRITVIAAGFDRWDEKAGREPRKAGTAERTGEVPAARPMRTTDLFQDDDDASDNGDEFDVPSFLR